MKEIRIYNINSTAVANAAELFRENSQYVYWNDYRFGSMGPGDGAFFIYNEEQKVIFAVIELTGIKTQINAKEGTTFFSDNAQNYKVAGTQWGDFIRFKVIETVYTKGDIDIRLPQYPVFKLYAQELKHFDINQKALANERISVLRYLFPSNDFQELFNICESYMHGQIQPIPENNLISIASRSKNNVVVLTENPEVEQDDTSSGSSEIEKPFDPKLIDISSKPLNLDLLFKRLIRKEINLMTDFQRQGDLWDRTKQSRLIESILIRFPLPAFYFDGSDDNNWLVVDGLQRLSALKNFVIDKTMKLENLEFLSQFDNYSYDELPRDLQRRIEEAQVTVYVINPGTPEAVKYNIFKRINTGGLVLEPQEIRHALNQGIPAQFIKELADLEEFKEATCWSIKTHRMLDRDFVTRFVSFYLTPSEQYEPDLDTFMTKGMAETRKLTAQERDVIKNDFMRSMKAAYDIFGVDAFRKRFHKDDYRKPINKALFEVWSVSLAKMTVENISDIVKKTELVREKFINLMNDDYVFAVSLSSGTGDKNRVIKRFSGIRTLIENVLES